QHDLRVHLLHSRKAHAQPIEHAGAERLDHHVVAGDEAQERLRSLRLLQIEADGALVAVERIETPREAVLVRREHAHVVADVRILELVDRGAEVGEDERAEGAGDEARKIEDADAGERWRVHAAQPPIENSFWSLVASIGSPVTRSLPW